MVLFIYKRQFSVTTVGDGYELHGKSGSRCFTMRTMRDKRGIMFLVNALGNRVPSYESVRLSDATGELVRVA
jgi:hypothetical protein